MISSHPSPTVSVTPLGVVAASDLNGPNRIHGPLTVNELATVAAGRIVGAVLDVAALPTAAGVATPVQHPQRVRHP